MEVSVSPKMSQCHMMKKNCYQLNFTDNIFFHHMIQIEGAGNFKLEGVTSYTCHMYAGKAP